MKLIDTVIYVIFICLVVFLYHIHIEDKLAKEGSNIPLDSMIVTSYQSITDIPLGSMIVTSYQSIVEQTDDTPCIPADGYRVHPYGVAVSRNLHKRWGGKLSFGDIVYIEEIGFKVVNDTMNKRHKNHFDIWVSSLEKEKEFHQKFKGKKVKVWLIQHKGE